MMDNGMAIGHGMRRHVAVRCDEEGGHTWDVWRRNEVVASGIASRSEARKRCRQLDEEERAAAAKPEPDADGIDRSWCRVGERVVFTRVADGQRTSGFDRDDGTTAWLVGGATGVIVEAPKGGYAEHRCPDHMLAPDCICGDDDTDGARPGYVAASESWAVVEWSAEDGGDPIRRALHASDEGKDWRRA